MIGRFFVRRVILMKNFLVVYQLIVLFFDKERKNILIINKKCLPLHPFRVKPMG